MLKKILFIVYIVIVVILGAATIVEKYHGTQFVHSHFYTSWWMCALWGLLVAVAIFYFLSRRVTRLSMVTLHLSFVVILIGALLTHLTSDNGMIHIRMGETADKYEFQNPEGGTETKQLPFKIRLDAFEVKKHEGTDAAEDYISRFTIFSSDKDCINGVVSMNNIYSHNNTRLYQTSYDEDEKGSYLTLNSDPYGILVTYIGYALLFIGLIWILVDPKGKYRQIIRQLSTAPKAIALASLFALNIVASNAAPVLPNDIAEEFGKLNMVYNDRVCPIQTYALDFTKKIYGKRSYNGYSAEQVLTGFMFWYDDWKKEKVIKVKDAAVRQRLNLNDYCSVDELFGGNHNAGYALGPFIMEYYNGINDKFHEGVSKLDDKVGLIMEIRKLTPLKVFPFTKNGITSWYSPDDNYPDYMDEERKAYMRNIFTLIKGFAQEGKTAQIHDAWLRLDKYQHSFGGNSIPDSSRLKAEHIYNRIPFATILFMVNLTLGFVGLIYMIWRITRSKSETDAQAAFISVNGKSPLPIKIMAALMLVSLLALSFCLVLRWMIRGTIPMSNGYETMLVMAWMIMLIAMMLFRKFHVILTFGFLLSGFFLLVSHISQMDPQITHLMPVLSSPLLTIHVSIIMMAYALLSLTFICGLTGVIFRLCRGNNEIVRQQLNSLQLLSKLFLYPSLTALGFGIFIGAIWANVSWGTYWSWDPKETWALITLMVYAVAVHDNSIPPLRKPFTYHLFMTLAFLTILMTYFGVNYFLGGMHSYA